jgi:hypothetical protein
VLHAPLLAGAAVEQHSPAAALKHHAACIAQQADTGVGCLENTDDCIADSCHSGNKQLHVGLRV